MQQGATAAERGARTSSSVSVLRARLHARGDRLLHHGLAPPLGALVAVRICGVPAQVCLEILLLCCPEVLVGAPRHLLDRGVDARELDPMAHAGDELAATLRVGERDVAGGTA